MKYFNIWKACYRPRVTPLTINDLYKQGERIMGVIEDFAAKVKAAFAKIGTDIDDLATDITALNAKITDMQNGEGLSPSALATLNEIADDSQALQTKADAIDTSNTPVVDTPPVS